MRERCRNKKKNLVRDDKRIHGGIVHGQKKVRVRNYYRYKNSIVGGTIFRHVAQATIQELYAAWYL